MLSPAERVNGVTFSDAAREERNYFQLNAIAVTTRRRSGAPICLLRKRGNRAEIRHSRKTVFTSRLLCVPWQKSVDLATVRSSRIRE